MKSSTDLSYDGWLLSLLFSFVSRLLVLSHDLCCSLNVLLWLKSMREVYALHSSVHLRRAMGQRWEEYGRAKGDEEITCSFLFQHIDKWSTQLKRTIGKQQQRSRLPHDWWIIYSCRRIAVQQYRSHHARSLSFNISIDRIHLSLQAPTLPLLHTACWNNLHLSLNINWHPLWMKRRNSLQHLQQRQESNPSRWLKTNPWMRSTMTYSSHRWRCRHSAPCESCYPVLAYQHIHSHMPGKYHINSTDQFLFLNSGIFYSDRIRFVFVFWHNYEKEHLISDYRYSIYEIVLRCENTSDFGEHLPVTNVFPVHRSWRAMLLSIFILTIIHGYFFVKSFGNHQEKNYFHLLIEVICLVRCRLSRLYGSRVIR